MRLILSFALLVASSLSLAAADIQPVRLQCNYQDNPLGVVSPSLGWVLEGTGPGAFQSAYEIQVATSPKRLSAGKADVWSSGKVLSDSQFGLRPEGLSLSSATTYWWRVRLWDAAGKRTGWSEPASFSTGLDERDWEGEWITPSGARG